jgi:DNA polymerase-3 subunit chi
VLLNLHPEAPDFCGRFQRVAEIVTPETRDSGRRRYRFYQERDYELETHKIT